MVLACSQGLAADSVEVAEPQEVSLTVYNGDLAVVRELREIPLQAGLATYLLPEVSGQIQPQSIDLRFLSQTSCELIEQNYNFDLISSDKLLSRFIGQEVKLATDNGSYYSGTLLSSNDGLVLRDGDNQVLVDPSGHLVLPADAADELFLRPTLSWLMDSEVAGTQTAEIRYASNGLSWDADYILHINDGDTCNLEGWVTLENYSGTTYRDANLKLVAGDIHMLRGDPSGGSGFRSAGIYDPSLIEESLLEFHLYDLQRKTTIANNQQKQISMIAAEGIPTRDVYTMELNGHSIEVNQYIELDNEAESGLGIPLPKGDIRIFADDYEGQAQYLNSNYIYHTPKNEVVRVEIGSAAGIVANEIQSSFEETSPNCWVWRDEVNVFNRMGEDIVLEVVWELSGEWKVIDSNVIIEKQDSRKAVAEVSIPAYSAREVKSVFQFHF